ncbi:MAG: hypothetical protein A3J74_03530 [Elusimicrobia bacterium RIFCSPHIGHO2_02_FULL_57_9]|nr:MAG: hypothetical protein A3J74_03530 [Elusimicrobia bacterium RIFCSPHIGHO2_02_FULL_57_9]
MSLARAAAALAVFLAGNLPAGAAGANDFSKQAVGTKGSEFLMFDLGARGIALGGAYTALTNDADSLYWNPAGLTRVTRFSASANYARHVGDINYQSATAAHRINESSVLAGGLRTRNLGTISQTDLAGNSLGSFSPRDYIAELGWGQSIYDLSDNDMDVSMGIGGRWIHSNYFLKADGYSADLGVQAKISNAHYPYDLGFTAQNMGRGQKFDQRRDPLPLRLRMGGAVYPISPLRLSGDIILPSNNIMHGAVGAEYALEIDKNFKGALRAGFNTLTASSLGVISTLSMGFGIKAGNINFDYAFIPAGVLANASHRFSVGYNLPANLAHRTHER